MLYGAYCSVYWLLVGVWVCVCVLFCCSLREREHSNLPFSLESVDAFSMRGTPVLSPYLWEAHLVRGSSFLCHLLLKHTFPRLSCLSYITLHSSNSSRAIKLMTNKVNQADTKRLRTFCHKSFPIKLENQDRKIEILYLYSSYNIYGYECMHIV